MKSILVATDGSKTANKALIEARSLAECTGASVTIIHVEDVIYPYGYARFSKEALDKVIVDPVKEAKESVLLLDEALQVFEGFLGEIHTVSRSGDAAEEIIDESEEGNYDLIIMGSKGLGLFSRATLGSISDKVLNHANKNVLIIK